MTIANSTISNNGTTSNHGGGITNYGGNLTIYNSAIYGNSTTGNSKSGGGIYNYLYSVLKVTNSTIYNNSATGNGGGIYNFSDLTVTNCTIYNNSSQGKGSGIYNSNGKSLTYLNTIMANSTSGYDCYNDTGVIELESKNNLVGNDAPSSPTDYRCGTEGTNYTRVSGLSNTLETLADNGGPTQTAALKAGSPAIDAGDYDTCTDAASAKSVDQRGMSRRDPSRKCDIGAYEAADYADFSVDLDASSPADGAVLTSSPGSLKVAFSQPVDITTGTQPANYLLVAAGANGSFDTQSCKAGLAGDDTSITVDSVAFDEDTATATLAVPGGSPLPSASYRLFICGTTSIFDRVGVKLNGGLSDGQLSFNIAVPSSGSAGVSALPETGFAPGQVTRLPMQPAEQAYSAENLSIAIPALGVEAPIVGVPLASGWDVSWLGNKVGYLEGSAYSSLPGNSLLAGHATDADGNPGIFASLGQLRYGQLVILHAWGQSYVYEVRTVDEWMKPRDTRLVNRHEEYSWLTLVTCHGWSEKAQAYDWRTVARAVLVRIEP